MENPETVRYRIAQIDEKIADIGLKLSERRRVTARSKNDALHVGVQLILAYKAQLESLRLLRRVWASAHVDAIKATRRVANFHR
jgi:hypothetical protein